MYLIICYELFSKILWRILKYFDIFWQIDFLHFLYLNQKALVKQKDHVMSLRSDAYTVQISYTF